MMKDQLKYSRRSLMKALGVGAALLPLIESDAADAACLVNGIKRLFILVWPDGMVSSVSQWATAGDTPAAWQLPAFQAALEPYKADLLLLNGVDYDYLRDGPASERDGHAAYPGMLTGALYSMAGSGTFNDMAGGPSVDQYIGSTLRAAGYPGLTSLNLGVFVQSTARLSWQAAGQAVIPDFDPYHVFATYFAGSVPTPMTSADPDLVKRSVLDFVGKDLNRFMGVVGSEDKRTIQQHLDFVRALEQKLSALPMPTPVGGACAVPTLPLPILNLKLADNVPALTRLQMDLAVAAFGADLTRVVVMQIGDQYATQLVLKEAGFMLGGPTPGNPSTGDVNGYNAVSHLNGADKVKYDTWFQTQAAYMIGQLKSVVDTSNKSLLDNTVFVGMNSARSGAGETRGVPVIMAGSCGGYFQTGRSLALTATPNNQLLVALCNAMGTPVQTFGAAMYGGELTVLKG